jgi:hypothetical protein
MNKLAKIIDNLDKDDLLKIKRDLIAGNIDKLIERKLNAYPEINFSEKQCPVCSAEISQDSFILEFGESYLRRKAYFDAADCLAYFVSTNLQKRHEEKHL